MSEKPSEEDVRKAWKNFVKEVEALQKKKKKKEYVWRYDLLARARNVKLH